MKKYMNAFGGWLILLFLLFATSAEARDFWVREDGKLGACSPSSTPPPDTNGYMSTPAAAKACANQPGDNVFIRAGTYSTLGSSWSSGTASSPITIAAYNNETVTIRPTNAPGLSMPSVNVSWIRIAGIIFDGVNAPTSNGIALCCYGAGNARPTNIVFDGIEVKNFLNGNGLELFTDDITVINSTIHNNGYCTGGCPTGQPHGFYITGQRNVIRNNEIFDNGGYGVHMYRGSATGVTNDDSEISNNRIYNNGKGSSLGGAGGSGIVVEGNWRADDPKKGFRVFGNEIYGNGKVQSFGWGIQIYNGSVGALVYNNTIYDNFFNGIHALGAAENAVIRNNIVSSNGSSPILIDSTTVNIVRSHNLCFKSGNTYGASDCGNSTNAILNQNPLLTDPGSGNFILQQGSPAIDAGTASIGPLTTIPPCAGSATTNCYNGSSPDIGAKESGVPDPSGSGDPPTLTPNLASVTPGGTIIVTVDDNDVNERTELTGDWIGIFPTGAANYDQTPLDWFYMNGTKIAPATAISDAAVSFTAPLTVGSYDFVFYPGGASLASQYLATASFTVGAPGIVIKVNVSSIEIGPGVTIEIGVP